MCMYACIYTHKYTHITHTHTYTHLYMHTYTHIEINVTKKFKCPTRGRITDMRGKHWSCLCEHLRIVLLRVNTEFKGQQMAYEI